MIAQLLRRRNTRKRRQAGSHLGLHYRLVEIVRFHSFSTDGPHRTTLSHLGIMRNACEQPERFVADDHRRHRSLARTQ